MNARVLMCLGLSLLAGPAFAQSRGQIRLPDLTALSEKASESVAVTFDSRLIGIASRFLSDDDPEEAKAKKLVSSLTGIYVRHYTFDDDYVYPKGDLEGVLRQLNAPGWSRIVEAKSRKDKTNVDVFILLDGDKAQGLAVIASEPREFTIVNIVGNIDLEQLHDLEGRFNIPKLDIEAGKKQETKQPQTKKP